VCGNEEAMNFLRYWLHLWHKRPSQCTKSSSKECQRKPSQCRKRSSKKGQQDDTLDHAPENIDEGHVQSVLLITGPSGVSETIFCQIYNLDNSLHGWKHNLIGDQ